VEGKEERQAEISNRFATSGELESEVDIKSIWRRNYLRISKFQREKVKVIWN
jgi:hypothetical protein